MHQALQAGRSVTLALSGSRAAAVYPLNRLPPAVEVQLATQDGSAGQRGQIIDLLPELLGWADAVSAVGSTGLYRVLKSQVAQARWRGEVDFLYGLVAEGLLPCGVGACQACTVETTAGLELSCLAGPVFDLMTLDLTR